MHLFGLKRINVFHSEIHFKDIQLSVTVQVFYFPTYSVWKKKINKSAAVFSTKIALFQVYIHVTSTSQHQIFDEKFDQEPENVRIKMADLAGR